MIGFTIALTFIACAAFGAAAYFARAEYDAAEDFTPQEILLFTNAATHDEEIAEMRRDNDRLAGLLAASFK